MQKPGKIRGINSMKDESKYLTGRSFHRDKTMVDKLLYIPNNDTQDYHFERLKLVAKTFNVSTIKN